MNRKLDKRALAVVAGFLFLLSCQSFASGAPDAIVQAGHSGPAGVLMDGVPVFPTIAGALESDLPGGHRIFIRNGVYREKLTIEREGVQLIGESEKGTVISWDDNGDSLGPDGMKLGTPGSATLTITAARFHAQNLTIENSFDYAANAALPEGSPGKVESMQAVAVRTSGNSDMAVFENVTISGYQDTLFVDAGRHYFRDCRILGHVDFIFGAGQAVFEHCDIVSRNRANKSPTGYISAPSTTVAQPYGLLFVDSRLLKESPDVPAASARLGRPWHPGGNPSADGSAVFMRCFMDDHIGPEGYAPISGGQPGGERVWFEVDERSRFFEYGSHGPGALVSDQRPQLTDQQAPWYSPEQVLNGWKPWENESLDMR